MACFSGDNAKTRSNPMCLREVEAALIIVVALKQLHIVDISTEWADNLCVDDAYLRNTNLPVLGERACENGENNQWQRKPKQSKIVSKSQASESYPRHNIASAKCGWFDIERQSKVHMLI